MKKQIKMNEINLRFWTNNLPEWANQWESGYAYMPKNVKKGQKPIQVHFKSYNEIPDAIRKINQMNDIKIANVIFEDDEVRGGCPNNH